MWFRPHKSGARWDAVAVQSRWRETETRGREAFNKMFTQRPPPKDPNSFYDLCLAEIDAVAHLNRRQCFGSMSEFIEELRHLQAEPTTPSVPPFSLQAYATCQKQWLEFLIRSTFLDAQPRRRWRDGLFAIPALAFLGLGVLLIRPALDAERSRALGLAQWQAFAGFLLCFLLFGLLCKVLARPSVSGYEKSS